MSLSNLEMVLMRADKIDWDEGLQAYPRYRTVMTGIAETYHFPLDRVVAAFVSLSPNSDYKGNLRSLVSVLNGINLGYSDDEITVSTYGHCRTRAIAYAKGEASFMDRTKGPKVKSFYKNILDPCDTRWVTIDGHMSAIWQGKSLTMRQALVSLRQYNEIKEGVQALAFRHFLVPCQLQAILWFTRKRIENVVYDPQLKLFAKADDTWNTYQRPDEILPYPRRVA